MALIVVKRASFFHREEVTPVVRYLLGFLVMGRRGLELVLHIFYHENDMYALADRNLLASASREQTMHEGMGCPTWT